MADRHEDLGMMRLNHEIVSFCTETGRVGVRLDQFLETNGYGRREESSDVVYLNGWEAKYLKPQLAISDEWSNWHDAQDAKWQHLYMVYKRFRDSGWIVHPDEQYGGHFVLYRDVPSRVHSEYIVLSLDTGDENLTWRDIQALTRIGIDVRKRLVLIQNGETVVMEGCPEVESRARQQRSVFKSAKRK